MWVFTLSNKDANINKLRLNRKRLKHSKKIIHKNNFEPINFD